MGAGRCENIVEPANNNNWNLWWFDEWLWPTWGRCTQLGEKHFPDDNETKLQSHLWVKDLFKVRDRRIDFSVKEYEQLIDIIPDFILKLRFERLLLLEFRCSIKKEYPELPERAVKILHPFQTAHFSESTFFLHSTTETKYRKRLNAEARLCYIKRDTKELWTNVKQSQSSH
jgi:hypothetical protein